MSYVNPSSSIGSSVFFIAAGAVALSARLCTRKLVLHQPFGLDDWLCVPAFLLVVACSATMIHGVGQKAVGYHTNRALPHDVLEAREGDLTKVQLIVLQCSIIALGCIKLSALLFYRRVFAAGSRAFSIINWCVVAFIIAWTIILFFVRLFECGRHVWYISSGLVYAYPYKQLHCFSIKALGVAFPLTDLTTDFVVLLLPLPWVWSRQLLSRGQKLMATAILSLGAFATAASFVRAIVFAEVDLRKSHTSGRVVGVNNDDGLGTTNLGLFWTMIELGVANITICLPSLRPLFRMEIWGPFGHKLSKSLGRRRLDQGDELDNLPYYTSQGASEPTISSSDVTDPKSRVSQIKDIPQSHLRPGVS